MIIVPLGFMIFIRRDRGIQIIKLALEKSRVRLRLSQEQMRGTLLEREKGLNTHWELSKARTQFRVVQQPDPPSGLRFLFFKFPEGC